jgi:hypothetical protein
MSGLLRFLGRILFVALLFHSAYYKLVVPEESKADFARGYSKLHSFFNSYGLNYLPSENEVPWSFYVVRRQDSAGCQVRWTARGINCFLHPHW